jgi:hypothetical protein
MCLVYIPAILAEQHDIPTNYYGVYVRPHHDGWFLVSDSGYEQWYVHYPSEDEIARFSRTEFGLTN